MVKSTESGEVRVGTVERIGEGGKRRKHLDRLAWKFKPMFYDGFLFRVFYWAESGYSRQSRSLAIREKPWRVQRSLSFSLSSTLLSLFSFSLSFSLSLSLSPSHISSYVIFLSLVRLLLFPWPARSSFRLNLLRFTIFHQTFSII